MIQEYKILFVCTGNTCRSYMAEMIGKSYLLTRRPTANIHISSAGTGCLDEEPASRQARTVMAEMGYTTDSHRARRLTADMIEESHLILTMTQKQRTDILGLVPEAKNKVFLLKEYPIATEGISPSYNLDIMDPFGQPVEFYRSCAKEISELVSRTLDDILQN